VALSRTQEKLCLHYEDSWSVQFLLLPVMWERCFSATVALFPIAKQVTEIFGHWKFGCDEILP
jgi:hypothetical protein